VRSDGMVMAMAEKVPAPKRGTPDGFIESLAIEVDTPHPTGRLAQERIRKWTHKC
jgi:hypothetical protein